MKKLIMSMFIILSSCREQQWDTSLFKQRQCSAEQYQMFLTYFDKCKEDIFDSWCIETGATLFCPINLNKDIITIKGQ